VGHLTPGQLQMFFRLQAINFPEAQPLQHIIRVQILFNFLVAYFSYFFAGSVVFILQLYFVVTFVFCLNGPIACASCAAGLN